MTIRIKSMFGNPKVLDFEVGQQDEKKKSQQTSYDIAGAMKDLSKKVKSLGLVETKSEGGKYKASEAPNDKNMQVKKFAPKNNRGREKHINEIVKGLNGKVTREEAKAIVDNQRADIKARKNARKELNKKKASNGLTYKQASEIIKRVIDWVSQFDKHTGHSFDSAFGYGNPYLKAVHWRNGVLDMVSYVINEEKLPPSMRDEYKRALAAKEEIEQNNQDLMNILAPKYGTNLPISSAAYEKADEDYEQKYGPVD